MWSLSVKRIHIQKFMKHICLFYIKYSFDSNNWNIDIDLFYGIHFDTFASVLLNGFFVHLSGI